MKNNYIVEGDIVKIELKRKGKPPVYAIIDLTDLPIVQEFPGTFHLKKDKRKSGDLLYAYAHVKDEDGKYTTTQLHRILMEPEKGQLIDHINHDGLDNRRSCNLRIATGIQNSYNRYLGSNNKSGTLGLSFHRGKRKWKAQLIYRKQPIFEKYYTDKESAKRDIELVREALTKVVMLDKQLAE